MSVELSVVDEKTVRADKNGMNFGDYKMDINAIPDLAELTKKVYEILCILEDPQIDKMIDQNSSGVKLMLNNKFADAVPFGIISILIDKAERTENVDRLMRMFDSMNKAKKGLITLDKAEESLYNDINERYVYSKYGSKEEFEKMLLKKK